VENAGDVTRWTNALGADNRKNQRRRDGDMEGVARVPVEIRESRQINGLTLAKTLKIALATVNVVNYGI
jgi:hypothetical protein